MNRFDSDTKSPAVVDALCQTIVQRTEMYVTEADALARAARKHETSPGNVAGCQSYRKGTGSDAASMRRGDGLPEFLINQGNVPVAKVLWALEEQERSGVFFGEILEKTGILNDNLIVDLLVHQTRIPYLSLRDYVPDREAISLIPNDFCKKYRLLPVDKLGHSLTVAMVNPLNYDALRILTEQLPQWRIQRIICSNREFIRSYDRYFADPTYRPSLPAIAWTIPY